jgi:hypothetical protein
MMGSDNDVNPDARVAMVLLIVIFAALILGTAFGVLP